MPQTKPPCLGCPDRLPCSVPLMYPNDVHSIIFFPKPTLPSGLHNRRSLEISFVSGKPPKCFLQKPPEDDINIASLLPTVYELDKRQDSTQVNTRLYTREDKIRVTKLPATRPHLYVNISYPCYIRCTFDIDIVAFRVATPYCGSDSWATQLRKRP